ncbi:MAG: hypothetical protein VYE15_02415 [Myxococcota bacterium]|nr:hypothetical protein [Myxococcota bacterium]
MALMLCVLAACSSESAPAADGLYLGDRVSFRLTDGKVSEFRFTGISCHIPNPDHFELTLCLARPTSLLPEGTLPMSGKRFSGDIAGVVLDVRVSGSVADGTWFYQGSCDDFVCGDVQPCSCAANGPWTAIYTPEQNFDVGGPGDQDAGVEPQPGEDAGGGPVLTPSVDQGEAVAPESASALQLEANGLLAEIRAQVGVNMAEQTEPINAAAQSHADYYALHVEQYYQTNTSAHLENADWPEGFTGVSFMDRMAAQGAAAGGGGNEVMAFSGTPAGAMWGWMSTLYHRIPLVHPNLVRWGFGLAQGGTKAEVGNMAMGTTANPGPARWPVPDATGVDTSWNGAESPQPPLPQGESYPSGPIITITFEKGSAPVLVFAELVNSSGEVVPAQVQHPGNDSWLKESWSIYAYSPLSPATTYTVTFKGTMGADPVIEEWSFTTH